MFLFLRLSMYLHFFHFWLFGGRANLAYFFLIVAPGCPKVGGLLVDYFLTSPAGFNVGTFRGYKVAIRSVVIEETFPSLKNRAI